MAKSTKVTPSPTMSPNLGNDKNLRIGKGAIPHLLSRAGPAGPYPGGHSGSSFFTEVIPTGIIREPAGSNLENIVKARGDPKFVTGLDPVIELLDEGFDVAAGER